MNGRMDNGRSHTNRAHVWLWSIADCCEIWPSVLNPVRRYRSRLRMHAHMHEWSVTNYRQRGQGMPPGVAAAASTHCPPPWLAALKLGDPAILNVNRRKGAVRVLWRGCFDFTCGQRRDVLSRVPWTVYVHELFWSGTGWMLKANLGITQVDLDIINVLHVMCKSYKFSVDVLHFFYIIMSTYRHHHFLPRAYIAFLVCWSHCQNLHSKWTSWFIILSHFHWTWCGFLCLKYYRAQRYRVPCDSCSCRTKVH